MASPGLTDQVRVSKGRMFAFALPAAPIAAMGLPLAVHLPPFYASSMGLGLSMVGAIFLLARFWDVFTDPLLGMLSDRFPTRWGRRRHWIVLSVPIMMLATVMIFLPPFETVSAGYVLFWLFVLYIGWTLLSISHMSWGAELTPDYHERSQVQGAREVALILGMVLVLTLPVLIEAAGPEDVQAARVGAMGWFVLIALPLTVLIAVWRVPERPTPKPNYVPMAQAFQALVESRALRQVLLADIIAGFAGGLTSSMFLFLAEDVLQLGQVSSLLLLCYFFSGMCFIPLMLAFARRFGKHRTAAASAAFNGITLPLILLVPPGNAAFALAVWIFLGVNMAAGPFLFRSIMADVADHDNVVTGRERTGLFYAMLTSTSKIGAAVAIGVGYVALDLIGFQPGGDNAASTLDGLRHVYVWPTTVLVLLTAWVLWRFPLDETAQSRNRSILERRRQALAAHEEGGAPPAGERTGSAGGSSGLSSVVPIAPEP